ncbi:MAG: response regulator [Gemmatimonadaceae bacterium]|nr:response regulator [Gemmatimonadaceae bacterium]
MLRRRLGVRLSVAFLALSLGTLSLASVVSYRSAESALRDRLLDQLEESAREDAAELTEWLTRHRETLALLASLPGTQRAAAGDTVNFAPFTRRISRSAFAVDELMILSVPGGRVAYSSDPARIGSYAVNQQFYLEGRNRPFTQPIYPSPRDGRPTLTVSTPIRGADGIARAVLAAHLSLDEMERVIAKPQDGVPIDAYLVSPLADFVSADRFGRPEARRGAHSIAIDSGRIGGTGSGLYLDHAGRPVIGAWRYLPEHRLALILESPQDRAFAPARALLARSLFVGLLVAALLTFGVVAIARRLTEPVLELADAADRVAAGDFNAVARVTSEDEIGRLAAAFNGMTARLRGLYGEIEEQVAVTRRALADADESRALLQDVVDNSTTVVLVVGLDGRLRLANARLAALARTTAGALIGRPLADVGGVFCDAILPLLDAARDARIPVTQEVALDLDGEMHTWQVVAFSLRDGEGLHYATGAVATDLTERTRLEVERRERDAGVQQQQRLESLGIMAGGIAHDFNNLLGAILGNVELLRAGAANEDETREALEQVATAARRAADLTRQMLAYAGRASLRREALDARKVLTEIVPLVRAAQSKKIEFDIEGFAEPLWIEADPSQLSQVALNLLTNAAEAIGDLPGHVILFAERLSTLPPEESWEGPPPVAGWIHLSVRDSGQGMDPDVQARIFDPFFTTKRDGRGLGLSAVRGIVQSFGGILRVTSAPEAGTRFDVYLPAAEHTETHEEVPSTTPTGSRSGVVLVVDDEEALRSVARRALERQGLKVVEAVDGPDGLARFRQYQSMLSLVMLDITMPGLNGIELLHEIRRTHPEMPAIIASGYDRPDELGSAQPDSRTRFLQKPYELTALREAVASLVKRAR